MVKHRKDAPDILLPKLHYSMVPGWTHTSWHGDAFRIRAVCDWNYPMQVQWCRGLGCYLLQAWMVWDTSLENISDWIFILIWTWSCTSYSEYMHEKSYMTFVAKIGILDSNRFNIATSHVILSPSLVNIVWPVNSYCRSIEFHKAHSYKF